MKYHPMIFTGESVRAIQAGTKTMTRRVIKPQPYLECGYWYLEHKTPTRGRAIIQKEGCQVANGKEIYCPYDVGDRLWIKETYADVNCEDGPALLYKADSCIRTWHDFSKTFGPDFGAGPSMDYEAYPGKYSMWWSDLLKGAEGHSWRSPIFMPRWSSRITLEITDRRIERLQEISEEDAKAEGVLSIQSTTKGMEKIPYYRSIYKPQELFRMLWDHINGKRYPWKSSPWVWVIEFKRVTD